MKKRNFNMTKKKRLCIRTLKELIQITFVLTYLSSKLKKPKVYFNYEK